MRAKATITLSALAGTIAAALAARALGQDSTLALLSDGYAFIPRRCQRYRSDVFETRLMLTKVVCMRGKKRPRSSTSRVALPARAPCPRRP